MKHSFFPFTLKSGLYVITCVPQQKHYVGQSSHVQRRLTAHKNQLRRRIHSNQELQQDFRTYGESNFVFQKLFFGFGANLADREALETLILETLPLESRYNRYSNWRKRGSTTSPFFGRKHTAETRVAQSEPKQGKPSGFTGRKQTNEVKRLVSQANVGKSDRRKSLSIDDVWYESITEASESTGLNRRLIRERCSSNEKRWGNYCWGKNDQS